MADTVTTQSSTLASVPSGTVIATDDAGVSGHVQLVKLALAADGSATPIAADADGLEVQGAGVAGTPAGGVVSVQGVASGTALPVSASALPLPSGASTAAKQPALGTAGAASTDVLTVQGVTGMTAVKVDGSTVTQPVSVASIPSHAVTNAGTFAVQDAAAEGSVASIDTKTPALGQALAAASVPVVLTAAQVTTLTPLATVAVTQSGTWDEVGVNDSGNSLTVDSGQLPATLAAGGGLKIEGVAGGVTVPVTEASAAAIKTAVELIDDSVVVFGTTTYTEASTKGVMVGAVRRDADTTLVDTTNEFTPLQVDASGRLKVEAFSGETLPVSLASVPSHAVTNAGTFAVQDAAAESSLASIDGKITAVNTGAVVVSSSALPTGAATAAKQPALGTAGTPSADVLSVQGVTSMTALKVDGSAVTQPVSAASLPLPSGASTAAKQPALGTAGAASADVLSVQGIASMTALKVDGSAVTQPVSLASVPSHAVTNAGTFAVQAAGDVAHDGVDSGSPVKIGARAIAHGANPTAVAAADRTDLLANRAGVQFIIGGHPNAKSAMYWATASGADDNVLPALATGLKYAITGLSIAVDGATTVNTLVRLGFGTATMPALAAAAGDAVDDILFYHPGMVPGAMVNIGNGGSILAVGADGAELRLTAGPPTTGNLAVGVRYFTIES